LGEGWGGVIPPGGGPGRGNPPLGKGWGGVIPPWGRAGAIACFKGQLS